MLMGEACVSKSAPEESSMLKEKCIVRLKNGER